ncbi:MAG: T9SS type A sorting domain-containing protein [Ignavibacteriaceae bacterium]|nr:T9SS type A sorting domain-containing protein [Ignavibacteriaceae bacterium]
MGYNYIRILSITIVIFISQISFAQQTIGSFPLMDGGFEMQVDGNVAVLPTILGTETIEYWSREGDTPDNNAVIFSAGGRSGSKYINFNFSATDNIGRSIQSPTTAGILPATSYVVQFYYKQNGGNNFDIRAGISQSGNQANRFCTYIIDANVGGTWTKFAKVITAFNVTAANGIGLVCVRPNGSLTSGYGGFNIDDFVVYQASEIDSVAPNPVLSPAATQTVNYGELNISWTTPSSGVDGGGYFVMRRAGSPPSGTPNVNGIYNVGNTIGNGQVVYIGTATSYLDTGLDPSTEYFYSIYTVDKAFNYSSPNTIGELPLPVELSSFSASVIGSTVKLSWRTETEVNNYGFEILRQGHTSTALSVTDWEKIGFVEGYGNSNSPKDYSFTDASVVSGTYSYRLKQIDIDGQFEYSKIIEVDLGAPNKYELAQNFPNPFNPNTSIKFTLPETGNVKLTVYNMLGQEIAILVNGVKEAGTHIINFNAEELNSGIYMYRIESNGFNEVRKMTLIK